MTETTWEKINVYPTDILSMRHREITTWEDVDSTDLHAMRDHEIVHAGRSYSTIEQGKDKREPQQVIPLIVFTQLEERVIKTSKEKPSERQIRLYDLVNRSQVDPHNKRTDIASKKDLIIRAGYPTLNGPEGEQVTIQSAKPSRIGKMVRDTYKRVSSYIESQNQ